VNADCAVANGSGVCDAGQCVITCQAGLKPCGGACNACCSDPECNPPPDCQSPGSCVNGSCFYTALADDTACSGDGGVNFQCCGGSCVQLGTADNCATCGDSCGGLTCVSPVCALCPVTCPCKLCQ
jgi:hypothetical protein